MHMCAYVHIWIYFKETLQYPRNNPLSPKNFLVVICSHNCQMVSWSFLCVHQERETE